MSALRYEDAFLRDLDRIVAHLEAHEAEDIAGRIAGILDLGDHGGRFEGREAIAA